MGGAAFIRVGLAVVQLVLRASGQDGAASTVGDAAGLWDQIRGLGKHRGNQVRAAQGIAEDIAAKLSGDPEYRDVSDNQWEAASAEVTDLLSGLSEPDRLAAEYSWEALRDALLADGGPLLACVRENRAGELVEKAAVEFDLRNPDWVTRRPAERSTASLRSVAGRWPTASQTRRLSRRFSDTSNRSEPSSASWRTGP